MISLGKYGSFHSNHIIGRPYHLTFEVLDKAEQTDGRELRVVRASEIHAETLLEEAEPDGSDTISSSTPSATPFDEYGLPVDTAKSNVNIIDNKLNQQLTYDEIEALKSASNPRELIAKIMANHSQLDQKTAFSLAKYTLRKQKKYMRRFTVLPIDVAMLCNFMMEEKDFSRIMEIRVETIGLIGSWANVHATGPVDEDEEPRGHYLAIDDTGGLVVAALAERMGILHHQPPPQSAMPETQSTASNDITTDGTMPRKPRHEHPLATSNTLTLVHPNQQPNLSLLRYFSFDSNQTPSPHDAHPHPLHTHLQTLTWLQLLDPASDSVYANEPPLRTSEQIGNMKPNARSNYYRKRRRWVRTKEVVDKVQEGNYNGLVIASFMEPIGVLKHLVPLLKGGAQVVVYSAHLEPLMEVADMYSTARRAAYIQARVQQRSEVQERSSADVLEDEKFPVDPTLLLTPTIHHSCARAWQVLPGRTHPMMMGKGGAEGGYVLVTTRVVPVQGVVVQARGKLRGSKKRGRLDGSVAVSTPAQSVADVIEVERAAKREKLETEDSVDVEIEV